MNRTLAAQYLANAARCYERAGFPADAARCHARAGQESAQAGQWEAAGALYEQVGTAYSLEEAANCYRQAGRPERAARCWELLGRPEQAAQDWYAADDGLNSAWALLRAGRLPQRSRALLEATRPSGHGAAKGPDARAGAAGRAGVGSPARELRRELGLAAVKLRLAEDRGGERLAALLDRAERLLDAPGAAREREDLERDAVFCADLIGRPDLAAELFAAAVRAGLDGAPGRWRAWARPRGLAEAG